MSEYRPPPEADRLLAAKLRGIAEYHAKWRDLTGPETAVAVAALKALAGGRADLLAQEAGLLLGFYQGHPNGPFKRCAAELLIAAGADEGLLEGWIDEGRRRRRG